MNRGALFDRKRQSRGSTSSEAASPLSPTASMEATPRNRGPWNMRRSSYICAAVFAGRRPTGEIYSADLAAAEPDRDWILTRILWLTGAEPGRNRGGRVDTLHRYIYIHGCPDAAPLGEPLSHGCIRMRNADLIALFDAVRAGTVVDIVE